MTGGYGYSFSEGKEDESSNPEAEGVPSPRSPRRRYTHKAKRERLASWQKVNSIALQETARSLDLRTNPVLDTDEDSKADHPAAARTGNRPAERRQMESLTEIAAQNGHSEISPSSAGPTGFADGHYDAVPQLSL